MLNLPQTLFISHYNNCDTIHVVPLEFTMQIINQEAHVRFRTSDIYAIAARHARSFGTKSFR